MRNNPLSYLEGAVINIANKKKSYLIRSLSFAAMVLLLLNSSSAIASMIGITTSAVNGEKSYINVTSTNSGTTIYYDVPRLEIDDFGTYSHEKTDNGLAQGIATYDLTLTSDETATFNVSKTGYAKYHSWGNNSVADGSIYFSLGGETEFSFDTTITSDNVTEYYWSIRRYDSELNQYMDLYSVNNTVGGIVILPQVTGLLDEGSYQFSWLSKNDLWNVYGYFDQTFTLDLSTLPESGAPIPEPTGVALFALGLVVLRCRGLR